MLSRSFSHWLYGEGVDMTEAGLRDGDCLQDIAHDLNNLLGAILGFASFIVEDCGPDHAATVHARRILNVVARGRSITERVLDVAPPRCGHPQFPTLSETKAIPSNSTRIEAGRVLLIDDDIDYGDMLTQALERKGFEVAPCPTIQDALATLRLNPKVWDLVITDLSMLEDGVGRFIEGIRTVTPDLPAIICTGMAEDFDAKAAAQQVGAFAIVKKPTSLEAVLEVLQRALGQAN